MRQVQVCSQGHRWDPVADRRPDEHARWNICPTCGNSVEMFSLHDTSHRLNGNGSESGPHPSGNGKVVPPADPGIPGYEVLGIIGYGGVGVVYKARETARDRLVAIKMLSAGLRARPGELARFQREAQAAAQIRHPNIVQILDVGERDGSPFVVMEFMDRGNLLDAVAGNPLPARTAAEIVEMVARGMETAHRSGIIHRDLKPANILLGEPPADLDPATPAYATLQLLGQPRVADFGLAKRIDEDGIQTKTGAVVGTPCYMAPEQAMGQARSVGPQADVYALGAILYQCLTAEPPFKAPTMLETLDQVRSQEPVPPSRLKPGVPRELETICLKCLEKNPANRYGSAGHLADDLQRFLQGQTIQARPMPLWFRQARWLARHGMATVVVLLAVTSLILASVLMRSWPGKGRGIIAQEKTSVAHFANFVKIHGVPVGISPLTPEQAGRRGLSFRFHQRGNLVEKVEAIDRQGNLTNRHGVTTYLGPAESNRGLQGQFFSLPTVPSGFLMTMPGRVSLRIGPLDQGGPCSWEYQRDEHGNLTREVARDRVGRIVWTFQLTSKDIGNYTDERGLVLSRAGSGATYVQLVYDEKGRESEVRFLGRNGKPRPDVFGIFGRRFEHDDRGLVTFLSFVGARNRPVTHPFGYAQIKRRWDALGNLLEESYLDLAGNLARGTRGAGLRWTYNADGNPTLMETFGLDRKPTSGYRMSYDDRGNLVTMANLTPQTTGPVRFHFDYDSRDNCIRTRYFDAADKPIADPGSGSYGVERSHDDQGRVVTAVYLGQDGKPALALANSEGGFLTRRKYVQTRYAYNDRGQVTEESYFGFRGEPVTDAGGVASYRYKFDDAGRNTELALFGPDGSPVNNSQGIARTVWTYDDQGRLEETASFDAGGRLAMGPEIDEDDPFPEYSPLMQAMETRGRLIEFAGGRLLFTYDDRGNLEQISLVGPNCDPDGDQLGVARVVARYDTLGGLAIPVEEGLEDEVGSL
ncbi:MAG: protein kinase domain-containing protein, partial [Gemmataceae bacterium]